jgi:prefoldin subunit 5
MIFKIFKQSGKEILVNLDNIVFVTTDAVSKKTVIYSITHSNEVDESFEQVKKMLGTGPKKEVGF